MRKLAIIGLAAAAPLTVTAVAAAQFPAPVVTATGKITPTKGGTPKKPKNARVGLRFTVNPESHKTLNRITYFIPKNVKLSGTGFKYCSAAKINGGGEEVCPKGSKLGSGVSNTFLGPQQSPLDFAINVYAGGKNEIAIGLRQTTGDQSIAIAFRGVITKASGVYGQKITVDIPAAVQQPAGGFFSYITNVDTTIGGKATKGGKTYYFASLTGCPKSKKHTAGVQLGYATNDSGPASTSQVYTDTTACRK